MKKKILFLIGLLVLVSIIIFFVTDKVLVNNKNAEKTPYLSNKNYDMGKVWCEGFQIAWNELKEYFGGDIEFEDGYNELADVLNKRDFDKEMLSENSYYVKVAENTRDLKNIILSDLKEKFNYDNSKILDNIIFGRDSGIVIYSMINKNFNFLEKFDEFTPRKFNDSETYVSCFGINEDSSEAIYKNVEILYHDYYGKYAIKLNTKENEEIILYTLDEYSKSKDFDVLYNDVLALNSSYTGEKEITEIDFLTIPCIDINTEISYNELLGKYIKGTPHYIEVAVQNISFKINQEGGKLISESILKTAVMSGHRSEAKDFNFCKPFVIFLKEKDKEKPYFSLKIEDTEFLKLVDI